MPQPRFAPGPEDRLTIAGAARLFRVSQPTLRRCDEVGKSKGRRHPINSYRLYLCDDLMKRTKKIAEGQRAA